MQFAILSAARFRTEAADWRIVLYTDRTESFAGLPVDIRLVDSATAAEWASPHQYVYRGKIRALADSLATPGTQRSVIVDGDTYFTRSPAELLARIAPGTAVMHVFEGPPAPPEVNALRHVLAQYQPVDTAGKSWDIVENEPLWNSGVVGLHTDDAYLCHEATYLTDQLLDHGFAGFSHIAEMLAFGVCLDRRVAVRECFGIITHYWQTDIRLPFLDVLADVWADPTLNRREAFYVLWARRPRPGVEWRTKFIIKRLVRRVGINV